MDDGERAHNVGEAVPVSACVLEKLFVRMVRLDTVVVERIVSLKMIVETRVCVSMAAGNCFVISFVDASVTVDVYGRGVTVV